MNRIATIAQNSKAKFAALGALALSAGSAFAQANDPFTTATTTITEKINTYGAALVGIAAVGVVFWVGIKYVKKISGAA